MPKYRVTFSINESYIVESLNEATAYELAFATATEEGVFDRSVIKMDEEIRPEANTTN